MFFHILGNLGSGHYLRQGGANRGAKIFRGGQISSAHNFPICPLPPAAINDRSFSQRIVTELLRETCKGVCFSLILAPN